MGYRLILMSLLCCFINGLFEKLVVILCGKEGGKPIIFVLFVFILQGGEGKGDGRGFFMFFC